MSDLELRYEHLGPPRNTPRCNQRRKDTEAHIARIWAEQEALNALNPPTIIGMGLGLPLAQRYRRERKERD